MPAVRPIHQATASPVAASLLARRLWGLAVLLAGAAAMLPWLAANAAVSGTVAGVAALAQAPRALLQAIDYAGGVALGR